jgi:hypothetical protein
MQRESGRDSEKKIIIEYGSLLKKRVRSKQKNTTAGNTGL